ncbi:TniB family NTP-binding protein [Vibrio natriegens]|uniref:TniB family NTP-binding protein n=1 Tax=Vibrio natriegens TaxID=691 RepID=UPI003F87C1C3
MYELSGTQRKQLIDFRECFIEYQEVTEIYKTFDRLILNGSLGGEQESLLLTGDTGSGKSALIKNYVNRFPKSKGIWSEMPVLNTRIPAKVKEQNVLERFLLDLESITSSRMKHKSREGSLTTHLIKQLRRKNVKLIIVNEIQELIEFKDEEERQIIVNTFKMINEGAQVAFVLVGMPYSELLTEESQWNSTLCLRRHLDYFHLFKKLKNGQLVPDGKGKMHFAKFVAGLASRMGFDSRPNLTSDDILLPLFAVCRGECRVLKHFLDDVLLDALTESSLTIDKSRLAATFGNKFPDAKHNPFLQNLEDLELYELEVETKYRKDAKYTEDRLVGRQFTNALPLSMLLTKHPLKA